jgi:lactate dehydrogenase-like 2-hydroxyacid dehydrogenase
MGRYDAELIRARGVRLASAAGVNAHAVAEHAMALILALKRHIHTGHDNPSAKVWRGMFSDIGAREDELGGKTLLVVGLGRIGARLARLAKAFDITVVATRRNPDRGAMVPTPSSGTTACAVPSPTSSRSLVR